MSFDLFANGLKQNIDKEKAALRPKYFHDI